MRYLEVENLLRKGKLNPLFVGLFEILERVGTLAYKVALPRGLSKIHNVFYVSTLRKYVSMLLMLWSLSLFRFLRT